MQTVIPSSSISSEAVPTKVSVTETAEGVDTERKPRRIPLTLKTTLGLVLLLMAAVGLSGVVFLEVTKSILRETRQTQLQQFAFALAGTFSDDLSNDPSGINDTLKGLSKAVDLDFMAITDARMEVVGEWVNQNYLWNTYATNMHKEPSQITAVSGQVHTITEKDGTNYVIAVPIFKVQPASGTTRERRILLGYLHVGAGSSLEISRIRYLEGAILLICMFVVLLALPMAYVTARHITVPIMKLAQAAEEMAHGQSWKVVRVHRTDEIGELADAFNTMAPTLEKQRADIQAINAGLETKVHQRTAELEKVNHRLQTEMAEKEDFLRAVSHDLNAPLRNISGMASILLMKYQDKLEEDALQRLQRIQKNVEVECELINELLELSRIKSRRDKIETVNLQELLQGLGEQLSNDLETRGITLQIAEEIPAMRGEKSRLRQAFQNLIDNAIKYMRPESEKKITLDVKISDDEVIFSVADTGIGISKEDQPHLFHVFRRAKNATVMKVPGKGVGLASVKSIFENYGGRLWVESQLDVGTTVFIGIPRRHFEALSRQESMSV